jgi:uncharacterized protein YutE (UPF0331/DUF86 family)
MALEKIINRTDIVQINIERIKKWIPSTLEEFLSDERTQSAIERCLQVSIEAIMDVCIQLVKFLKLGTPNSPDGVLILLEPHLKSIAIIRKLKGLRNILVHQYGKIDPELIFKHANQFCIDGELIIKEFIGIIRG